MAPARRHQGASRRLKHFALVLVVILSPGLLTDPAGAASPPAIDATWVTEVTATSADLRSRVNPEASSTSYRFEYLTEAAYEANLAAEPLGDGFQGARLAPPAGAAFIGAGSQTIAVAQHVSGLTPLTAYRYRAVAESANGTTVGPVHVLRTEAPSSSSAPLDTRAWEMVSPVDKNGGAVGEPGELFGGGQFQAAAAGGAATYGSATAFGEPVAAPPVSQYLSTRTDSGWETSNVSRPLESGGYGDHPDGAPFRVFSVDLVRGLMLEGRRCTAAGTCPPRYSLWSAGGSVALPEAPDLRFAGASPDLRHVVLSAAGGLFEWSGGALETISATPGAALAAPIGAVSTDGSHIYFSAGGDLYLHDGTGTVQVDAAQGGGGEFQAASSDGSVAFFLKSGHLFRYDGSGTARVTPAEVTGVLGVSASGAYVYYQDAAGLWQWHLGDVAEIATGPDIALPSDYPPATATARVSADGTGLAFLSAASIPPFDNLDAEDEVPDTELYLYGPPPGGGPSVLLCVSCNPTGERPRGSTSIPGAEVNGSTLAYRPRVLSGSGHRLFFDSADRLTVGDTNSRPDVYEWEAAGEGSCTIAPGCVGLVSGGRETGGRFVDASADGTDVFFTTEESLVDADPGSIDLYDYRAGGGFPPERGQIPCVGDACQPLPSPPEDPAPGTLRSSSANPPPRYDSPRRCRRRFVRRKGRCVRRAHARSPRNHAKSHRGRG